MGLVSLHGWTLVLQLLNTFILYIVLKKLLFKPVKEFMENRQNNIVKSIEEAEKKNKFADEMKKEYQGRIDSIEQQGRKMIEEASKKAEQRASSIVKEAEEEASKVMKRVQEETKREHEKLIHTLKDEVASLAVMAAGKIVNENLKEENHQKLIQDFLDEVGDAKWQN
ncbi:F0F1 ATP synthase subunit B [Inediibacterium massiliense]|uniref:F0F1 ATP synthase subunit B n=1 Tax=Inediibacterium massiliense TaxID=1658111 RepID=UPI0006B660BC|nr:F0F1 ATP synthase subunit B [Inediibacterium massiliense]